ncbi:MAG: bifunctional glycosyltransferase family 2/GtrA family protein [Clostridia bacterium]|nr:bifunctional glycosyltransferase family 2/GtrA family protein [Clostridia bacterium]
MQPQQMPIVLIPSLEPDERLPRYVRELMDSGFDRVVVVNDGSSAAYQPVFDGIAALGATVLGYEVNRGKGGALKYGYQWILDNEPACTGVLTADADGQHTVPDCLRLAEALASDRSALWLGSRDFTLPDIPPKSSFGNKMTSAVFKLSHGVWLPDTQTGLRAFAREELPFMIGVEGTRYEYEMNVLIACAHRKMPIRTITIETIYENNNEGTHFHPIRDSWRIYKVILGSAVKYAGSALVSWLVDYLVCNLLYYLILPASLRIALPWGLGVMDSRDVANYTARIISGVVNFALNRRVVFNAKGSRMSGLKYAVVWVACIVLSTLGIKLLNDWGVPVWLAKLVVDTALYFMNYLVQKHWVFAAKKQEGRHA